MIKSNRVPVYMNRSGMHIVFCYTGKKFAEKRSFKVIKHYSAKKMK